ncbi:hypothetical protein DMENIID0001_010810 [Sergentomyia squamirostris]
MCEKEFENFFILLIRCITSRTLRPIRGNYSESLTSILVTTFTGLYAFWLLDRCQDIFLDDNIGVTIKIMNALMFEGILQYILKNLGGAVYHKQFIILTNWIEDLYKVREENEVIREIVENETKKALKFCITSYKIYIYLMYTGSFALFMGLFLNDAILIQIRNFDIDSNSWTYHMIQMVSIVIIARWHCLADAAIIFIGIYIIIYVNIVNRMIKSLTTDPAKVTLCPDLLIGTLKKHVKILEIFGHFNDAIKLISLLQLTLSLFMLLTLLFGLQVNSMELSIYLPFICVMVQLFILCCFGEFIQSRTEDIFQNLYLTNWHEMNLKDQKVIYFMLINSLNAIGLKAGGMYNISLVGFVQILKLSFSFSAMMITFTKK